jgi:hypothetical protein
MTGWPQDPGPRPSRRPAGAGRPQPGIPATGGSGQITAGRGGGPRTGAVGNAYAELRRRGRGRPAALMWQCRPGAGGPAPWRRSLLLRPRGRFGCLVGQGCLMNADGHRALRASDDDDNELPGLTVLLAGHLEGDQVLRGLVAAIGQVRSGLAARARLFEGLRDGCAVRDDRLGQAFCRRQVLDGGHAVAVIDEAIVEMFGLRGTYGAQPRGRARSGAPPTAWPGPGPGVPPRGRAVPVARHAQKSRCPGTAR